MKRSPRPTARILAFAEDAATAFELAVLFEIWGISATVATSVCTARLRDSLSQREDVAILLAIEVRASAWLDADLTERLSAHATPLRTILISRGEESVRRDSKKHWYR